MKTTIYVCGILQLASSCLAVSEFTESFGGAGDFTASNGLTGFENPDWLLLENNNAGLAANFADGALIIAADPIPDNRNKSGVVILNRQVSGQGSFTEQVTLRNFTIDANEFIGNSVARLTHWLLPGSADGWIEVGISNIGRGREFMFYGRSGGSDTVFEPIEPSSDMVISMSFDQVTREASFFLDANTDDDVDPISLGPLMYDNAIADTQETEVAFVAGEGLNNMVAGDIDFWSLNKAGGDFNDNGLLDTGDIDLMTAAVLRGTNEILFDIDFNGEVNQFDRNTWIHDIADTFFGDANLDGEFNSADLVAVFAAAEYEDATDGNSSWAEGDWNGDGDFTSRDLVIAFQDGAYEQGPRFSPVMFVPEPPSSPFMGLALLLAIKGRNYRLTY